MSRSEIQNRAAEVLELAAVAGIGPYHCARKSGARSNNHQETKMVSPQPSSEGQTELRTCWLDDLLSADRESVLLLTLLCHVDGGAGQRIYSRLRNHIEATRRPVSIELELLYLVCAGQAHGDEAFERLGGQAVLDARIRELLVAQPELRDLVSRLAPRLVFSPAASTR